MAVLRTHAVVSSFNNLTCVTSQFSPVKSIFCLGNLSNTDDQIMCYLVWEKDVLELESLAHNRLLSTDLTLIINKISNMVFIQLLQWFKGLFKDFSRTSFDSQGPPTRNVIPQTVQKYTFPVHCNRTLRIEQFTPPTSLHFSFHLLWSDS